MLSSSSKQILMSHGCFRHECSAGVEHSSNVAIYSLRNCDIKTHSVFAFAESMNQAFCKENVLTFGTARVCLFQRFQVHVPPLSAFVQTQKCVFEKCTKI